MYRLPPSIFAVSMLLWAVPVTGQESGRLEEVQVTAGRIEQRTEEVPAGVSVVNVESIERQSPVITADLLRGVTGAFVQQTTPGQGIPIIRGLKGSEVLHLVDGMRLNNAFFRNAPNQYFALVDARILSQLEVVRGPSPSLYGADAMGGVVQLISKIPEVGVAGELTGELTLDYATADEAGLGHLSLDQTGRKVSYGLAATYQDVGDRRAGNGTELTDSAFTSRAVRAVVNTMPLEDHEWMFDVQYLRQPGTPRHDELVPGFGQDEAASEEFSFEPNERLFAHARYRWHDVSDFIDDLEFHAAFQSIRDDRRTRDTGSTALRTERNTSDLYGLTLQMHSVVSDTHRLTYGVEAYFDEVSSRRLSTDIDTGESAAVRSRFPDGSTMNSLAVYLHDEIVTSGKFRFDVGGRFTSVDVEMPAVDGGLGADISVSDLTGNVGLVYDLTPRVNIVSNLGRGFRAPNIFDLGTLGPRPGNRFNIANPDLQPEEVITVDLGLKFAGARFIGEAMIWKADYRDKITSAPTGQVDASGRSIVQSRNSAQVDLWGIEAGARLLSADRRIEFSGVLNYSRGDETDDAVEQPADRVPPLNGRIGILYRPDGDWWIEGFSRFAAKQDRLSDRDAADPRIDPDGTPGWATVNIAAGFEINRNTRFQVRLANLFDKRYREHGSGIDAPGRDIGLTLDTRF